MPSPKPTAKLPQRRRHTKTGGKDFGPGQNSHDGEVFRRTEDQLPRGNFTLFAKCVYHDERATLYRRAVGIGRKGTNREVLALLDLLGNRIEGLPTKKIETTVRRPAIFLLSNPDGTVTPALPEKVGGGVTPAAASAEDQGHPRAGAEGEPERDARGRFAGDRVDIEAVPRLPTFPARRVIDDPRGRGRPYFVFWTTSQGDLSYRLRMVRVADGAAVKLSTPETRGCRIELLRRPMPRRGGITLLYRCPCCKAPRRYLYGLALMGDRIVEDGLWRCHYCARLLFASQGRYHRQLGREIFAAFYGPSARVREPLPRRPWDPQAVSDPRLVVDRFRGALVEASPAGEN